MRKRIRSFILAVGLLLTMMPDTAMAARMERDAAVVRESGEQENMAGTGESDVDVTAPGVLPGLEGSGTTADPYRIKDAEQLRIFADMVNGAGSAPNTGLCAVLTQNIDLSGVCSADIGSWTPIGADPHPYTGIFDGGSFAVSGLYCHKTNSSCVGLFGCNAGTIKNLGVVGADIDASSYTGGVCGYNQGIITGCYNTSTVSGESCTGGVCGYNDGDGTVSVCYNTGAVSGSQYVGGICGYNKNVTSNSYNTGKVISNSYNVGTVTGGGTYVGGICGYNRKLVSNCYNTGEVGGKDYVGSVCGYNHPECTILNCYYLITGTEKGNYGVAMTRQQFASGEVCWLLNDGKSENVIWHQTCGAGFPAFGGKTVYQMQTYKQNGNKKDVVVSYTNDKNRKGISQAASAAPANSENNSGETAGENMDGHVYQEPEWKWKEYKSATAVFTCQDCGEQLNLKAKISKKEKAATCVEDGETVYTACVKRDDETYEDTKKVKVEKTGHKQFEEVFQEPVTCEKPGISQDCWRCPACKKYFKDRQGTEELLRKEVEIPALKHNYSLQDWYWDMGNNPPLAVAAFLCGNCGGVLEKEAKVTVKAEGDCTTAGDAIYTAVVKLKDQDQRHEDTRVVSGQPTPHSYGNPKWEWADDHKSATAVFTCRKCGAVETIKAQSTSETTKVSTCTAAGEIKHTAVVELGGRNYTDVEKQTLAKAEHIYGEPEWKWASDYQSATAIFTCEICNRASSEKADVTPIETPGKDCGTPGTITYTATVTVNQSSYTDQKVIKHPAKHTLKAVDAQEPACETNGNEAYWECSVCAKLFSDAKGSAEITGIPVIPATGHDLELKPDEANLYVCTVCNKTFRVTEEKDGTIKLYSVEDDAVIPQDEQGIDSNADFSDPDGVKQSEEDSIGEEKAEEERVETEPPVQSDSEEDQDDPVPPAADVQDSLNGENEQGGTDGQGAAGEPAGENEQAGEGIPAEQDGQQESGDGITDVQENAARYGIIYPEGEEAGNGIVTEDAVEGNAVSLRADTSGDDAVQAARGQQELPLWGSAAALFLFVGIILCFVLKKGNN